MLLDVERRRCIHELVALVKGHAEEIDARRARCRHARKGLQMLREDAHKVLGGGMRVARVHARALLEIIHDAYTYTYICICIYRFMIGPLAIASQCM